MACPRCRKKPPPSAAFCPKCGADLKPSARPQHPAGIDPDLHAIARTAARLCEANDAVIHLVEGDQARFVARHGRLKTILRLGEVHPLTRDRIGHLAILERRTIHVRDLTKTARAGFAESRAALAPVGVRTVLATPLLRDGAAIGSIVIRRTKVRPFTPKQIALLEAFAEHAATAIEKTRLAQVLAEALEQQTATSEILRVIASSPTDLQPVMEAVAASAARLCGAYDASIFRRRGDSLEHVAHHGPLAGPIGFLIPLVRGTVTGRSVLEQRTIHVADLQAETEEFPEGSAIAKDLGHRAMVNVPLMREGVAIGALQLCGLEPNPFTDKQIRLLETFADQAVIAIENVRLFKELEARNRDLTNALEQQTATSDVLRIIAQSPTELQPVLNAIATSAVRLCGASDVVIERLEDDHFYNAAHAGTQMKGLVGLPLPLTRRFPGGRAVLERRPIIIDDIMLIAESEYPDTLELLKLNTVHSCAEIPLLSEGKSLGNLAVLRAEVRPFTEAEVALLQTFADQAVIAIENVRLFKELEARNRDLTQALEQQTATAEVLRVIGSSPTDAQPVFEAIVSSARRLLGGLGGSVYRLVGDKIHLAAYISTNPSGDAALRSTYPRPLSAFSPPGEAIRRRAPMVLTDIETDGWIPDDIRKLIRERGNRSGVWVPMMREGVALGAIGVTRSEPGGFADEQIALLKTFADQAVIAIENVRLFTELEARNRDLTATSEILQVISTSTTDVQPVFQAIAEAATRLSGALFGSVYRFDGELIHMVAQHNYSPAALEFSERAFPTPPTRRVFTGRAILERGVVHVRDVALDPERNLAQDLAEVIQFRSVLSVPMLRDGYPIGAITVWRSEVGGFTDQQVALFQTFADQAVIAIENVRLFKELEARNRDLTEALEQQTATGEILRVISGSPTDTQPVFDVIAANAARLCGATDAIIRRVDGDVLRLVAQYGALPGMGSNYQMSIDRGSILGRAVVDGRTVHVHDLAAQNEEEFPVGRALAQRFGYRTALATPLLREGGAIGAIGLRRMDVHPFSDKQIQLLETFAAQAVIAIENVRLFTELQARTTELTQSVEQLTALGEISRAVSSTLDVETVLRMVVSRARQLASADGCLIYEYDEASQHFHLRATDNLDTDYVEAIRGVPIRKDEGVSGRAAEMREPFQVADIAQPAAYESRVRDVTIRAGYRAVLSVPLLREDEIIGSLILIRKVPGEFSAAVIEALKNFATQSALAIQNARLFHEIEDKGRQLEVASRHKSQFLANMSHELRTPLNAILGYTELLIDGIYGEMPDKARETMARIERSGRHLLALINDVLDLSKIEAGQLTLSLADYSLSEIVNTVVTAMEPLAAEKRLALRVALDPALPMARGDDRRISQVLLNLVGNAVKFTDAGEVRVEGKVSDGAFVVSVSDTGPGIAAEDQARIFEEFQQVDTSNTRKKGGTGLGLSIAKRILALHGGRIWVESAPGKGSTFFFSLPVRVERMAEVA